MAYPKEFLWGVSTAAAQVEGGAAEDGRSPSIWDAFAAEKKVMNAKYFPTACDSYHRFFSRDLANLKALGVNSYRMSLSWSRVLPEGTGKLNEKGVDYYKRAFEALLEEGITPNVTLYHWDLPQVLEDRGGWANRDCIEWFGEYAEKMFRLYSDLVPYFATVNEPIATYIGYAKGKFAPGHKDETLGNRARHNLLVAHGRAVEAFRAVASKSARSASSSTCGSGTQSIPPRKTLPPSATRTSAIGSSIPILSSAGRIPIISYLRLPAKGRSWRSKRAILPSSIRPSTFSGCHINPAVSLAMLLNKKMTGKEFVGYVVSQVLGAIAGAAIVGLLFGSFKDLGGNAVQAAVTAQYGDVASLAIGLIAEIVLTFGFVLAILGVTSKTDNKSVTGIVIGLTVTLVHLLGIRLTGTSVNPARSLGPALLQMIGGDFTAISQIWIFIIGPLAGAALAALVYRFLDKGESGSEQSE